MTYKKLVEKVSRSFLENYGVAPLLTFAPGRINLIGEHTDYNDGFVFPAAIDKGIVVGVQKNNSPQCSVYAMDMDILCSFELENIQPLENGTWQNYVLGVVYEVLQKHEIPHNFDMVFSGNIPAGSGMSSSAALENSVVMALNTLFSLGMTREEMIVVSQKAEHNFVGVKCGIMDQYASMFGKENAALLLDCRSLEASFFAIDFKDYELVLVNTNVKHSLAESAYNDRRNVCEKIAAMINVPALRDVSLQALQAIKEHLVPSDYEKALYVVEENLRVQQAGIALENNCLEQFGALMFESHKGLQEQYKVSCTELDFIVAHAKQNSAVLGARMMGGGFGGCTINLVLKGQIQLYTKALASEYKKEFQKECTFYQVQLSTGAHIVNLK